MKPEAYRKIREPVSGLYRGAAHAASLFLKAACGLRVETHGDVPVSGPLLVLCSHEGMADFAVTAAALLPRKVHFVCAEEFFRRPVLAPLLHALGVIPKTQFSADPRSILSMLRVVGAGGIVCLYPAGQTSMVGRPGAVSPVIARLIRKCGAPVAALRLHGGFFTRSRFAKGLNFGRIDAELSLLFTKEEAQQLDAQTLCSRLEKAIDYDEYAWQKRVQARFFSLHRARGYENMLSMCPRCGARGSYVSRGSRVRCEHCGNGGIIGRDMRLHADEGSVLPETLPRWLDMLRRDWDSRLAHGGFLMKSRVRIERWDGRRFRPQGGGVITLDEQAFCCLPDGGEPLRAENDRLEAMRCVPGRYLEMMCGKTAVRMYPEKGRTVTEWKLAQEYLHGRSIEKKQQENGKGCNH